MKPQSTIGALPTEDVFAEMDDILPDDDSKLDLQRCLAFTAELSASLGVCGVLHWLFT